MATPATLLQLLTYLMEQHDVTRAHLIPLLGTASRVREVLNGKRALSMSMIREIRERFHVPGELLVPPTHSDGMTA